MRPYVGLGILGLAENSGLSMYNGLQFSAQRRLATGLQFDIAYTYSKLRDNASPLTDIMPDAYSDKGYYGTSDLDRTARADRQLHLRATLPWHEQYRAQIIRQLGTIGDQPVPVRLSVAGTMINAGGRDGSGE